MINGFVQMWSCIPSRARVQDGVALSTLDCAGRGGTRSMCREKLDVFSNL